MGRCKWCSIFLTGLAFLLASSFAVCGQQKQESPCTTEEQRQIEEREFFELYSDIEWHIEHADTLTLGLQNFGWHQFANVGWSELDRYGVKEWILVSQVLPPAETVKPSSSYEHEEPYELYSEVVSEVPPSAEAIKQLLAQCDKAYALTMRVWSDNPYKEPQTVGREIEKSKILEWREQCGELESALAAAKHQAQYLKTSTEQLFSEIERIFSNERPSIKAGHLENFQSKSTEYTKLIDEVADNLEEARKSVSELRNWQFSSINH